MDASIKPTTVINLFGGSGIGKSTLAAGLFYEMKSKDLDCELVREYVKNWAWDGIKIKKSDQPYIFGKQSKCESRLYNKVDYVITDSPVLLSSAYEEFYGERIIYPSIINFLNLAKKSNVNHINLLLTRHKKFRPEGRYETESQAIEFDKFLKQFLINSEISFTEINCIDELRVKEVLKLLDIK